MSVSICVEAGYELHCLTVTDAEWQMIKTGVPFAGTLESSYEGEKFSYQFSFNSGFKGQLSVDYNGEDDCSSGEGFSGSLEDAHMDFDND